MSESSSDNRRRFRRVGFKDPERPVTSARFFLLSDARKQLHEAPVLDISLGGLSLLTSKEVPVGSTIQLLIEPLRPSNVEATMGGAYRLLAEVRWGAEADAADFHLLGLMFLPVSTAESRNRKGLERIMQRFEEALGNA